MSVAGLGFLWGFYLIQWPGSTCGSPRGRGYVPCPDLLAIAYHHNTGIPGDEVQCQSRAVFSVIMISVLVVTLAGALFLGALLLKNLLGWSMFASVVLISRSSDSMSSRRDEDRAFAGLLPGHVHHRHAHLSGYNVSLQDRGTRPLRIDGGHRERRSSAREHYSAIRLVADN